MADTSTVPTHQRQDAEVLVGEERRPLGAGQELDDRHLAEEADGLDGEHGDDAGRGAAPRARRTGTARAR